MENPKQQLIKITTMDTKNKAQLLEALGIDQLDFPTIEKTRRGKDEIKIRVYGYEGLGSYLHNIINCVCLALENDNVEKNDFISISETLKIALDLIPQSEEMQVLDKLKNIVSNKKITPENGKS